MEIIKPIIPNFKKCEEIHNMNRVVAFNIARTLNDVYDLQPKWLQNSGHAARTLRKMTVRGRA